MLGKFIQEKTALDNYRFLPHNVKDATKLIIFIIAELADDITDFEVILLVVLEVKGGQCRDDRWKENGVEPRWINIKELMV